MRLSRGSSVVEQRTESSRCSPSGTDHGRSDGETVRRTDPYRALLEPIDASLSLWGDGRRERITALEADLWGRSSNEAVPRVRPMSKPLPRNSCSSRGRRRSRSEASFCSSSSRGSKENVSVKAGNESKGRPGTGHDIEYGNGNEEEEEKDNGRVGEGPSTQVAGRTLADRLALWDSRGWRPPRLRDLPRGGEGFFSGWTHIGQPDRFELVKSANRSVGSHGDEVTDGELEWMVLCLEEVEARMTAMEFSVAAGILENVLGRCPGFTLAYYRLALCLLAARGEHASDLARRLLECAMHLEGAGNPHLRNAVDLIQRILSNDDIPEEYWSEDYPKSLGDLRALETTIDNL